MRQVTSSVIAMSALALSSQAALSATANVPFTSVVTATCVLTVGTPGVMAANTDFTSLSSTSAGGVSGTVSALSTGTTFKVSAIAPTTFQTAPAGGGTSVDFSSVYRATGATTIGTTPGATMTTLNSGSTNIVVDLAAVKSSGTFDAGAYSAEVIVRCE